MKMKKLLLIIVIASVFSLNVAAQEIGSIVEDSSKETPSDATYSIGIFNLKEEPVIIEMEVQDFEGDVDYETQNFRLEPSEVSSNPSGSGWISASGGNYVKPEYQKINVVGQQSQNFSLEIQARRLPENRNSDGPTLVQVVSHGLSYQRTSDSIYLSEDEQRSDEGLQLQRDESSQEQKNDQGNGSFSQLKGRLSIDSESGEQNQETTGIDPLTILLSIGAAGSVLYLWSVL